MTKFIDDIYKILVQHIPETSIEYIIDQLFEKGSFADVPWEWPIEPYVYLTESFDSLQLTQERKIAQEIFRTLWNEIYKLLPRKEQDMIGMYKTYGTLASFPYDIDGHRLTSLYRYLDNENCFSIDTPYGPLTFEFAERSKYGVSKDFQLAYDDEKNRIIIFVKNGRNITTKQIIDIFVIKRDRFLHELQHFVDKMTNKLHNKEFDENDPISYLNTESEFKANLQRILGSFGRFLFKNYNEFKIEDLRDKNKVDKLFGIFIGDIPNPKFQNVVSSETQKTFRIDIYYLNPENKKEFYNQLYRYTSDYYNTNIDMDLNENRKKELIRLFRLEENFLD